MFATLWESTKFTAHLFFRIGYATGLVFMTLIDWLKVFPLVDKWVFTWFLPRGTLFLLASFVTSLPTWVLVLLMFAPPGLFAAIIFFSFMGALVHF